MTALENAPADVQAQLYRVSPNLKPDARLAIAEDLAAQVKTKAAANSAPLLDVPVNVDPDIEQKIIGAVIASQGRILFDLDLTDDDFATPQHQSLWKAARMLADTGRPLSPESLARYVMDHNRHQLVPLIAECANRVMVPEEAVYLAPSLQTLSQRRRLEQAALALKQLSTSAGDYTAEELAELARSRVDEFTKQATASSSDSVSFLDAFMAGLEEWDRPDTNVMPTGWRDLDQQLTGGLRPGHLVVVGARTSVGKSLVATELARHVAARKDGHVLFVSLEMNVGDLRNRIVASQCKVPLEDLNARKCSPEQMDHLVDAAQQFADWPLKIVARGSITVNGIRGAARDLTRHGKLSLVVVDYLQLVDPADGRAPREQQIAAISRGLKQLAMELNVPVVALSQINRSAVTGDPKATPKMHQLRDSGAIEQDADEILLLHRTPEEAGVPEQDDPLYGRLLVIVEKNRHGAKGAVELSWMPGVGRIGDLKKQ